MFMHPPEAHGGPVVVRFQTPSWTTATHRPAETNGDRWSHASRNPDGVSSKNLLPLGGGENSEHLPVFCDGPAGYLDPLPLLQQLYDRLIAERVLLVFLVDELLDGLLDALAGDVLVGHSPDARIE